MRTSRRGPIWALELDGDPVGFYHIIGRPPEGELSDLWLDSRTIGRGLGRELFRHALIANGTLQIHRQVPVRPRKVSSKDHHEVASGLGTRIREVARDGTRACDLELRTQHARRASPATTARSSSTIRASVISPFASRLCAAIGTR